MDTAKALAFIDFGTFRVHDGGRLIPIQGYVVRGGDNSLVLLDTGYPDVMLGFEHLGEIIEQHSVEEALAKIDLRIDMLDYVVLTHSDVDHIGGIESVKGVPIVCHRDERALPDPRWVDGTWTQMSWPEAEFRLIDADTELVPGLTLLDTPGHSPGHLSALVRLRHKGPVILAVDAITWPSELETETNQGAWNADKARDSLRRLVDLADRENAWLVFGHDQSQREEMRNGPVWYN